MPHTLEGRYSEKGWYYKKDGRDCSGHIGAEGTERAWGGVVVGN